MYRLAVLTIFLYAVHAYRVDYNYELEDMDELYARGVPGSPASKGRHSECKKDILILWDNSWSVGSKAFKGTIRPFIESLITNPALNVGPDGTHIGILTFSTQAQTKVLRDVGEIQTQEAWMAYLDNLRYEDVMGDGTRTGMALKMADEMFTKTSPNNYRSDAGDVVIIFTDGEPNRRRGDDTFGNYPGNKGETQLATDRAKSLKEKDVTVVGLAVGNPYTIAKFEDAIKGWASEPTEKYYLRATVESVSSILDNLVSASCIDPGQCLCDTIEASANVAFGGKALMSWPEPSLKCASNRPPLVDSKTVQPQITSPHEFGVGRHTITYTYGYRRGSKIAEQKCYVNFEIKACRCPSNVRANAELPAGGNMASVSWQVPKPNCPMTLTSVSPPQAKYGSAKFPIGQHSVVYKYAYNGPTGSFSLSCPVTVTVKGKLCAGVGFNQQSQVCCCGTVHDRKSGYECCGPRYYDTSFKRCDDYYTLVDL